MISKTILLASGDRDLTAVLATRCRRLGLSVVLARDGANALERVTRNEADILCVDARLPDHGGLQVCADLRASARYATMPMILLADAAQPELVMLCHDLCVYYVPPSDAVWPDLEALIREVLELGPRSSYCAGRAAAPSPPLESLGSTAYVDQVEATRLASGSTAVTDFSRSFLSQDPGKLLVIDDEVTVARTIGLFLNGSGLAVTHCDELQGALANWRDAVAVMCDVHLPSVRGSFIACELREAGCRAPIIMMSGDSDRRTVVECTHVGISGFLVKPFSKMALLKCLGQHLGDLANPRVTAAVV